MKRLGLHSIDPRYFDCAARAPEAHAELAGFVARCVRIADGGPGSPAAMRFIQVGDPAIGFPGMRGVFHEVAQLLGRQDPEQITFHYNTTEAFRSALVQVGLEGRIQACRRKTILTSDTEYPGFADLMRRLLPGARVYTAQVREKLWSGLTSCAAAEFARLVDRLHPDVVLLSHVCRSTGAVIPVFELIRYFRRLLPDCVWIVDGAQAVGNTSLNGRDIQLADYYLGSAHKHLLSSLLGFCCRRKRQARSQMSIAAPVHGYSFPLGLTQSTVDLKPFFAIHEATRAFRTNESLSESHRLTLAQELARLLRGLWPQAQIPEPMSGIVGCRLPTAEAIRAAGALDVNGVCVSLLDRSSALPALRFATHTNQGSADVRRLVDTLFGRPQRRSAARAA